MTKLLKYDNSFNITLIETFLWSIMNTWHKQKTPQSLRKWTASANKTEI